MSATFADTTTLRKTRTWIWDSRIRTVTTRRALLPVTISDGLQLSSTAAMRRYDGSGRPTDATLVDIGQSLILSYFPSEFSQIRGQYRRINYADGPTANEFL